jgi:hypothetical protein
MLCIFLLGMCTIRALCCVRSACVHHLWLEEPFQLARLGSVLRCDFVLCMLNSWAVAAPHCWHLSGFSCCMLVYWQVALRLSSVCAADVQRWLADAFAWLTATEGDL